MPAVSVIMNCYNGEEYLREAVDSIINQTYPDWELIFYDNASTDSSPDIIESYQDPRIRYYCRSSTVPLGQARNHALSMASGDYIAFLDVDDYWMPCKLEKQLALFNKNNSLAMVFGDTILQYMETNIQRQGFQLMLGSKQPPRGRIFPFLLRHYVISMGTVLIKKACLAKMSEWFDESMYFSPDFDLFMRIAVDSELDYVNEIVAFYRVHPKSLSNSVEQSRKYKEPLITLTKIRETHPEIAAQYKRDLQFCMIRTVGLQLWKQGQSSEARKIARAAIMAPESMILWFLSFLPFSIVEKTAGILKIYTGR